MTSQPISNNPLIAGNTSDPSASTVGYAVGSMWLNTTSHELFICIDSCHDVWIPVSPDPNESWVSQFCRYHKLKFNGIDLVGGYHLLSEQDKNMSREEAQCRAEAYVLENM